MSEPNVNPELEQKLREALEVPAPDAAFANRLRATLIVKAAGMKPEPQPKRFLWRFGFAMLVLALLAVFFGPKIVTAMKQLFGYVPGAGLVDQSAPLRVLAEPVFVTRDGVTLTVKSAVLSTDKTVIVYTTENVPWESLSHREDVPGCYSDGNIRLPNGSLLTPISGGGSTGASGRWEARIIYSPVPPEINDAEFLLDCIHETLPGLAPENWELPLHFVSAPPDMTIMPVVEIPSGTPGVQTGASVDHGFILEKVIETENGYILVGKFHDASLPDNVKALGFSVVPKIIDANGVELPYFTANDVDAISTTMGEFSWTLEIKGKAHAWPLTLQLPSITTLHLDISSQFTFNVGQNPQPGQEWILEKDVPLGDFSVRVEKVSLTDSGYLFDLTASPDVQNLDLNILNTTSSSSSAGGDGQGHVTVNLDYEQPPVGVLTVKVTYPVTTLYGNWSLQWQPENPATGVPSPYGIALTIDKYIPLDDGYYLIGHTDWTDKRISRVSLGDWTNKAFDAAGREIPLEPASASNPGIDTSDPNQWVFKIYGKAFNGPVTLRASQVTLWFANPPSVEIDIKQYGFTGGDDQLGYVYKVGMLPLDLPGLTAKVQSLAFQRERDLKGFTAYLQADPSIVSLPLDMFPIPADGQRGSGGSSIDADGRLFSSFFSDGTISGQFKLIANTANITGNWAVEWIPPVVDAAAAPDSPSPACLDLPGWKKSALSPAPAPNLDGTLAVYGRILDDNQPPTIENYGILLTSLDGSQQKTFGQGINPSLSADGARLAYNWQDGLHVVDTATGRDIVLPGLDPDDFGPKLSPDGAQLVFVRPADMNLYLVNADGSNLRQLTDTPASEEYASGWTSDGSSVIYLKLTSGQASLVAKNISSWQESALFVFPASVGAFSLSPDARTLAYTAPVRGRMAGGIYTVPLDGSSAPALLIQLDHWTVDAPIWSPDGQWLLFNLYNTDSYAPAAIFALLNVSTCQVFPLNVYEGMAQAWVK